MLVLIRVITTSTIVRNNNSKLRGVIGQYASVRNYVKQFLTKVSNK